MPARLRQVVVAARELEPLAAELRHRLGLGAPYADPGVAGFGLRNAVMPVGDCFVEVVAPASPSVETAAGRYLLRRRAAAAGYMVMFEVSDIAIARSAARALGVRAVWEIDLPEISGTHLHPSDMGGAIVSIDQPRPPGSWRWAGPDWAPGKPGGLRGAVVAVPDPDHSCERWAAIIGAPPGSREGVPGLEVDGAWIEFQAATRTRQGLIEVVLDGGGEAGLKDPVELGGVRFRAA